MAEERVFRLFVSSPGDVEAERRRVDAVGSSEILPKAE
jgi:hypothetical protein